MRAQKRKAMRSPPDLLHLHFSATRTHDDSTNNRSMTGDDLYLQAYLPLPSKWGQLMSIGAAAALLHKQIAGGAAMR